MVPPRGRYDVEATIARFETLMARRLGVPQPVWYWQILKATTLEESAALASEGGRSLGENELETGFALMVARNFSKGLALGAVIFLVTRLAQALLMMAGAGGQQLP